MGLGFCYLLSTQTETEHSIHKYSIFMNYIKLKNRINNPEIHNPPYVQTMSAEPQGPPTPAFLDAQGCPGYQNLGALPGAPPPRRLAPPLPGGSAVALTGQGLPGWRLRHEHCGPQSGAAHASGLN